LHSTKSHAWQNTPITHAPLAWEKDKKSNLLLLCLLAGAFGELLDGDAW